MPLYFLRLALTTLVVTTFWMADPVALQADESALKQLLAGYTEAFNKHDAKAVASFWTEKCVHIDRQTGERTEGRQAIEEDLKTVFENVPNAQFSSSINSVRMVQPTVASVEGETRLSGTSDQPVVSAFTAIVVAENGTWLLDSVDESPIAAPSTSSDALQELAWLVGEWQDESDKATVQTSCRWSANQSFLLRSYTVQFGDEIASTGTQVIGWDARRNTIRSWNFDSDGGFGEAVWSKSGDQWLVRGAQTSPDGALTSGTYVFDRVGADEIVVHLIGRETEGSMLPNEEPIRVVRVAVESDLSAQTTSEAGAQ